MEVVPAVVEEDASKEEMVALESHKMWAKNVPNLYDVCVSHALDWPSLTVQWMPSTFTPATPVHDSASYLLMGTHASDNEPNYLMLANVALPSAPSTGDVVRVCQKIAVDSEINRARACPQLPSVVACQTGNADFLLFDINQHPSRPLRDGVCVPQLRLRGHRKQGYGISWSTLQTGLLVSGSDDKMIGVYDINATPVLHSKDSSELRSLASSHESGVEPLLMLSGHSDVVEDVCCSLHSAHEFLSCSDDGTIRMWDSRVPTTRSGASGDNAVMCVLNAHEAEVNAVAYSPFYDTLFASVSADRTAAVWDRRVMGGSSSGHSNKAATPVAVLDNGHVEQVFCVAWSPHHPTRLLTGAADRRICMWDLSRLGSESENSANEMVFMHSGHTEKINDLSYHPSQDLVASVADNGMVQVWQPSRNAIIA